MLARLNRALGLALLGIVLTVVAMMVTWILGPFRQRVPDVSEMPKVAAESFFHEESGDAVAMLRAPEPPVEEVVAVARVIKPKTECVVDWPTRYYDGNAVRVLATPPVAGRECFADFRRTFTHAPVFPSWLLLSTKAPGAPVALDSLRMPGCWLLVNPEGLQALAPSPDSLLRETGQSVRLTWTPPRSIVGAEFWLQLVWVDPHANGVGTMWSPMLHWRVGLVGPAPR